MINEWAELSELGDNYLISRTGEIKNITTGKILKNHVSKHGYYIVSIFLSGKIKTLKVHRLLALAFIEKVEGKNQVNHINGIKKDNNCKSKEYKLRNA